MVQIFTASKILKIILPYTKETQLAEFDKNLFYSFFQKKFVSNEKLEVLTLKQRFVNIEEKIEHNSTNVNIASIQLNRPKAKLLSKKT